MVACDFKCTKCGSTFEVTCHMDEHKAKAVCPKCGGRSNQPAFLVYGLLHHLKL